MQEVGNGPLRPCKLTSDGQVDQERQESSEKLAKKKVWLRGEDAIKVLRRMRARRNNTQDGSIVFDKPSSIDGQIDGIVQQAGGMVGNYKHQPLTWDAQPVPKPNQDKACLDPTSTKVSAKESQR